MLTATKTSLWKRQFAVAVDGRSVATWAPSTWLSGGTAVVEGQRFRVRTGLFGSTFIFEDEDGGVVATAHKAGRKNWTLEAAEGAVYEFRRTSLWGTEQEMLSDGQRIGCVKNAGFWRSGASADLPGMPLPLQVFTLAVILTVWARNSSAAAGGAGVAFAGGATSG